MYLVGQVDEDCEGIPFNSNCSWRIGPPPWTHTLGYATVSPTLHTTDSITLEMVWSGTAVNWYYQINGGTVVSFYNFTAPSFSHNQFAAGSYTMTPDYNCLPTLTCVVKYFQFGVDSDYNTGNTGWTVKISNPEYRLVAGGSWTLVPQADAAQGSGANLDYTYKWGGQDYVGVAACYAHNSSCSLANDIVSFSTTSNQSSDIADGTPLWG